MPKSTLRSNLKVNELTFNDKTPDQLRDDNFYNDWPVVYVLNNNKEMYIGETYHAVERMKQHLKNPDRRRLNECRIFASEDFTKSATLDIESSLIELCASDNVRILQNANPGIAKHNYANKKEFAQDSEFFKVLWDKLFKLGLVKSDIENLKNKDIFKYSPYKSLNAEQCTYRDSIIEFILDTYKDEDKDKKGCAVVNGSAGTGKTILALYLLKILVTGADYINEDDDSEIYPFINDVKEIIRIKGSNLKVGYVVAMTSFRSTLNKVLSEIKKHNKKMRSVSIIGPNDVAKEKYDVLIVDEAHRLKQSRALGAEIGSFYKTNSKLGFTKREGDQLDWIIKQSKVQILFYDRNQTIKPCDVDGEKFLKLINSIPNRQIMELTSQMRCLGGNDYIKHIENILDESEDKTFDFKDKYDFYLFDDVDDFCNEIYDKEEKYGLSRIVAGYGFKWISKNKKGNKNINKNDINIGNRGFQWNKTNKKWPLSISGKRVIEEVGCIHTIQGYDCNYCGVIFGPEIYYDGKHIRIDRNNYFDENGKRTIKSDDELLIYIKNIYKVLLTRGIKGTYLYACDNNLNNYLSKYIKKYEK